MEAEKPGHNAGLGPFCIDLQIQVLLPPERKDKRLRLMGVPVQLGFSEM